MIVKSIDAGKAPTPRSSRAIFGSSAMNVPAITSAVASSTSMSVRMPGWWITNEMPSRRSSRMRRGPLTRTLGTRIGMSASSPSVSSPACAAKADWMPPSSMTAPLTTAPACATCALTFMSVTALSTRSGLTSEGTIACRTGIPKAVVQPSTNASPSTPQMLSVPTATSAAAPPARAMPMNCVPNSSTRRSSRSARMPA